ncbi:uncharacterized protein B0I36DRAFT_371542 [Microdochium trichocladiopsis]|uniref:Tyrosinase copper-binding domain-containing protein n=1 Tax=Microdochium trichocladiopsis TaxID=1682393 RepID=A0A9P8YJY5_9PEZI|nr:uncharacterized protein B0I36DRAFT_371542 [Microdochium trichocladiopsis]KAH7041268.1 hypothetical protein B0I36DRAFT_371542 [Microdochium trichocladiopsis]
MPFSTTVRGLCALSYLLLPTFTRTSALPTANSHDIVFEDGPWPHGPPGGHGGQCTRENAIVRREWDDMTRDSRLAFIAAVKCMKSKPSRYPKGVVPAAISLYDDLTTTHINGSFVIHFSGIFLSWHRRFVHIFEEQLYECGYPRNLGTPYWDWTRTPDIDKVAMFDGSDESLGGNGDWDPTAQAIALGKNGYLPRGTGGGCVTKGPFANETIRFGPFPGSVLAQGFLPEDWKELKERCFTRDLNPIVATNSLNSTFTTQLLAANNISQIQVLLTPPNFGLDFLGLHRAGHCAIGDPMSDFFASPQDVVFYLHHAGVDRMWTTWQDMDPATRRYAYNGTSTIFNPVGVTPEVDNSTIFDFGILAPPMTLKEGANPMSGMYCYRYE